MSGFESDNLNPNCTSATGDDAVIDREFVQQIDLTTLIEGGTENTVVLSLQDVYFAEVIIRWTDLTLGTQELSAPKLSLAPNPSTGSFTVTADGILDERLIEVRDMTGRLIHTQVSSETRTEIELENVAPGTYFVSLAAEGRTAVEKLIIR